MLPNTLEWHSSWIKPTLLEVFVLPFVFLVSYFFFFRHQTSHQEPCVRPTGGERCTEEMLERWHEGQGEAWSCQAPDPTIPNTAYGCASKVFLVHIFVILIALILNCRTEDIKKGFKHLGQHPNLAECMKFCPEYHNAVGPERVRLDKIVADSLEYMR